MTEKYKIPLADDKDTIVSYSEKLNVNLSEKIHDMEVWDYACSSRTVKLNKRLQHIENKLVVQTEMICVLLKNAGIDSKEYTDKIKRLDSKIDPSEFN